MRLWNEIHIADITLSKNGNIFIIKGQQFRFLAWSNDTCTLLLTTPVRWYWPVLVIYRLYQSFIRTEHFIVIVLSIWGLADWDIATVPTWECIHSLRWLAQRCGRSRYCCRESK